LFNSNRRNLRKDVKDILLFDKNCSGDIGGSNSNKDRKRALLIDEIDVLFAKEFFGQLYTPSTDISHKCIEDLATFVWQNRGTINYKKIIESQEFIACVNEFPKLQ